MTLHRLICLPLGLLLAALFAAPVQAQTNEIQIGELPALRFGVGVMQSAQYLQADEDGQAPQADQDASFGFHRVRFNLTLGMDINDRINAIVDLGHEPNDFGESFAPMVDYAVVNVAVTEQLIFQFGTPGTALFNFQGFSDGAAVQDNPLIGNSPADVASAETGVALIGAFDPVDVTVSWTVPTFFEDFGPGRGYTLIGRASAEVIDGVSVGAATLFSNNGDQVGERDFSDIQVVGAVNGDGESYNLPSFGAGTRTTHAGLIPGLDVQAFHVDAQLQREGLPLTLRAWFGTIADDYSFADGSTYTVARFATDYVEDASRMDWFGGTAIVDVTEQLYVAGRAVLARNQSNWADGLDDTDLLRIQAGAGLRFAEYALFKLEYVTQNEGDNGPGQVGADWQGALAELSVVF